MLAKLLTKAAVLAELLAELLTEAAVLTELLAELLAKLLHWWLEGGELLTELAKVGGTAVLAPWIGGLGAERAELAELRVLLSSAAELTVGVAEVAKA